MIVFASYSAAMMASTEATSLGLAAGCCADALRLSIKARAARITKRCFIEVTRRESAEPARPEAVNDIAAASAQNNRASIPGRRCSQEPEDTLIEEIRHLLREPATLRRGQHGLRLRHESQQKIYGAHPRRNIPVVCRGRAVPIRQRGEVCTDRRPHRVREPG